MASIMEDPNDDPQYVRRLDRTPETDKSNVAKLSNNDRKKIYGLRTAFSNTISKLQRLEESNDEKDLAIERERELRKNLEKKLMETKLVDMYSDPAVNEELNDRLPRAAKERMYSVYDTPRPSRSKHRRRKAAYSDDDYSAASDDENARRQHRHNHTYPGSPLFHPPLYPHPGMYGWPLGPAYPPPFTHQSTPNANASQSAPPGVNFQPMMSSFWPQTNVTQNQGGDINAAAQDTLTQPSDVNIIKAASMLSSDSKEKQISRLLQEIDLLKDQNRKVSEELAEQVEVSNRLKVEAELREVANKEKDSSKVSALIQEIYEKQRQRDRAMMGRLKLANEERDRALTMINSLKRGQTMEDIVSDTEDGIASSQVDKLTAVDISQRAADTLSSIHGTSVKTREVHSQRVKELANERDAALRKVSQLESEMLKLQREVDELLPLQDEHLKLKKQLATTQQERDLVISKLSALEEDNSNLKIYYGLHKALSKEQSWKEQYNNSLNQMQQVLAQRDGTVIDAQKETNQLQEVIQELTDERDLLRQNLQKLHNSEKEHLKNSEKLQRHVSVLQKKLKRISHGDLGSV